MELTTAYLQQHPNTWHFSDESIAQFTNMPRQMTEEVELFFTHPDGSRQAIGRVQSLRASIQVDSAMLVGSYSTFEIASEPSLESRIRDLVSVPPLTGRRVLVGNIDREGNYGVS